MPIVPYNEIKEEDKVAAEIDVAQEGSPFLKNYAVDESKETLAEIGRRVVEDFKSDLGSRHELEERITSWHKLYVGLKEVKNSPWPNAANVKLPILSTACLQFHARIYNMILPSREIAKCWSTDGTSIEAAERCQNYLNYQLNTGMEEWIEDEDALLLMLPLYGSVVKKTYYDPGLGRPVSLTLRLDEFVAPYGAKRLEDAPRKTHIYPMHLNDIRIKGKQELWINTEDIGKMDGVDTLEAPSQEHKRSADENIGVQQSAEARDKPRKILEQHRTWDLDGDGIEEWYMVTVDQETEKVLRIESLEYVDPITQRTKKFEYFTPYTFIPNPDSWMGLGFGHLLEHLNLTANALTNQLLDSGSLSNNISGMYNTRSGIKDGDIQMTMGQFNGVDMAAEEIAKSIFQFKFNPPSNVLFALLEKIESSAKELSSVSDTMLGNAPPSDTTATTVLTIMEQGLKLFSTIGQRTHRSTAKEFKKIALLNSYHIDEDVYFVVQDSTGSEMQGYTLGKNDFRNSVDVMPLSDPNITSNAEKLIKARQAYELGRQDELIAENRLAAYYLLYNLLDALEVPNIDQILTKPEPPPPPPDLRPEEEEAEFLAERGVNPLPTQDHGSHLASHNNFKASDSAGQLTPQGKKLLDGHIRETNALFYLQLKQSEGEAQNEQNNAGTNEGLGGEPVYAGANQGVGGATDFGNAGFSSQG